MIQTIPIKETRDRLADLVNQVDLAGKQFIITKFGQPKAMLVAVPKSVKTKKKSPGIKAAFGIWKDRKDITDSALWVAKMRAQWSTRND